MFWERFSNLCEKAGTKPNPVGKEIGISSGIITKWKNVGTLPNGETLLKIADYFNVSVDYLLGRTEYPEINNGQFEYAGVKIPGQIKVFEHGYVYTTEETEITPEDIEEAKNAKNIDRNR